MFDRAVEIVLETKRGSVSLLQRRLAIGYTRASRLIDLMGIAGILSDHKGSVARDVLISIEEWDAMKELVAEDQRRQQLAGNGANAEPEDPHQTSMFVEEESGEIDEEPPFETDEPAPGVVVHGTLDSEDEEDAHLELEEALEDDGEEEEEYEIEEDSLEDDEGDEEGEEEYDEEVGAEYEEDEESEDEDPEAEYEEEAEEEDEEVEYEYVDEDGNPIDPEDLEEDEYELEDASSSDEEGDEELEYEEDEYEEDESPTTEPVR